MRGVTRIKEVLETPTASKVVEPPTVVITDSDWVVEPPTVIGWRATIVIGWWNHRQLLGGGATDSDWVVEPPIVIGWWSHRQ